MLFCSRISIIGCMFVLFLLTVYPNVSTNDLLEKKLEISVWHFTAEQQNDICLGTLNLQLAGKFA